MIKLLHLLGARRRPWTDRHSQSEQLMPLRLWTNFRKHWRAINRYSKLTSQNHKFSHKLWIFLKGDCFNWFVPYFLGNSPSSAAPPPCAHKLLCFWMFAQSDERKLSKFTEISKNWKFLMKISSCLLNIYNFSLILWTYSETFSISRGGAFH